MLDREVLTLSSTDLRLGWTDEREAMLSHLWADMRNSASSIAKCLGGMTRNAVIGKAHRLGLGRRRSVGLTHGLEALHPRPLLPRLEKPAKPPKMLKPRKPPKPEIVPIADGGLGIMELQEVNCRAIIGYAADGLARYCGSPKRPLCNAAGESLYMPGGWPLFQGAFCPGHAAIYYDPERTKACGRSRSS